MADDLLARAKAPWYAWDPSSDFVADSLRSLSEAGELDGTIGALIGSASEPTLNSVVLPTLEALGITPAEIGINDAPTDDQVLADAQNTAILQKFEAAGVDTILAPNNDVINALTALETSSYRPRVIGTNSGSATTFIQDPSRDRSVLEGFVTTGTYGPQSAQMKEPDFVACADVIKAAGVEYYTIDQWSEGQPKPWVSASAACMSLRLFTAIATKAGTDLNYGTFRWAGDNLGELKMPGYPTPFFYGAPPHADGDSPVFIYDFDPTVGDLVIRP
jgi:hypothetical protein